MLYYYSGQQSLLFQNKEYEITNIKDLNKVVNLLSKEPVLSIDTETTGLDPIKHSIIMIQFGTRTDQYIIDVRGLDFSVLSPIFSDKNRLFVGQNLKFDYNMLKRHRVLLHNIYDTMLAEMVLENGKHSMEDIKKFRPFSLKTLCKKYLYEDIGKETREEFLSWGDSPFTLKQIIYGAKDVIYPLLIKEKQEPLIKAYELERTISLENKTVLALADIEYNGIHLDSTLWLKANKSAKEKLKTTLVELDNILIDKEPKYKCKLVQLDIFSNVFENPYRRQTDVNWDSPQQVIDILTKVFNIHPIDKDGKLSSGTKALLLLNDKPPIINTLIKFRKESKSVSSFGDKFLRDFLYPDNRIRTTFNSIVETGRISSRKPNMQQIPRDKEYRYCFTAPEDKLLIVADYSNQEGRIMADMSGDKSYIDFFNYGDGDAHSFVASTLYSAAFGKEFIVTATNENKEYRQKGKVLNFFISFGGSAYTLSNTLKISTEEAQFLIDNFYKGFPGLKVLFENNASLAIKKGYIRTNPISNRIRWMKGWSKYQQLAQKNRRDLTKEELKEMSKIKGKIERRGKNTPIQGTAGDMSKTALILIRNELLKNNILPFEDAAIKMINVVHDK